MVAHSIVLLELEIEDDKIVLSNEDQWTFAQLNDEACFKSEEGFLVS